MRGVIITDDGRPSDQHDIDAIALEEDTALTS